MTDWLLTPGMPADRGEVMALYRACTALPGCAWSQDYPAVENFDEDIEKGWLYCLREGGQIIAVASVGDFGELVNDGISWSPVARPCELARIGVLPTRNGQGIGAFLLRRVIAVARGKGFGAMRLLVSPGNAAAVALYRRAGFRTVGEDDRFDQHWLCQERLPL